MPLRGGPGALFGNGARQVQVKPSLGDIQAEDTSLDQEAIPSPPVSESDACGCSDGASARKEGAPGGRTRTGSQSSAGSTSAGSAAFSPRQLLSAAAAQIAASGGGAASPYETPDVLAHSYPVPVVVKNTFIDVSPARPVSLEGFFAERVTVSCPGSGLEPGARPYNSGPAVDREPSPVATETDSVGTAEDPGADAPPPVAAGAEDARSPAPRLPPGIWRVPASPQPPREVFLTLSTTPVAMSPLAAAPVAVPAQVGFGQLSTPVGGTPMPRAWGGQLGFEVAADHSQVPQSAPLFMAAQSPAATQACVAGSVGAESAQPMALPSMGSTSHGYGNCKPCAFLYTKGCNSGESCPFCHLCKEGEKKRRVRDRREDRRDRHSQDSTGDVLQQQ